jgi:hypothetical protein
MPADESTPPNVGVVVSVRGSVVDIRFAEGWPPARGRPVDRGPLEAPVGTRILSRKFDVQGYGGSAYLLASRPPSWRDQGVRALIRECLFGRSSGSAPTFLASYASHLRSTRNHST